MNTKYYFGLFLHTTYYFFWNWYIRFCFIPAGYALNIYGRISQRKLAISKKWTPTYHSQHNQKALFGKKLTITQAFGILKMVEFGTEVEIDDNQRKEIFVYVQYCVFSEEDKQAYMLQLSEEEIIVWLRP